MNDIICGGNDIPDNWEDYDPSEPDPVFFQSQVEAGLALPHCNWRGGTVKRLGNCELNCGVNRNRISYPDGCCCYGFSTSTISPISETTA